MRGTIFTLSSLLLLSVWTTVAQAQEEEERLPIIKRTPTATAGAVDLAVTGLGANLPSAPAGQEQTGDLSGVVTDAKGHPIVGADVELLENEDDDEPIAEAETDINGRFELLEVDAGTYVLTVGKLGFDALVHKGVPILAGQELSLRLVVR